MSLLTFFVPQVKHVLGVRVVDTDLLAEIDEFPTDVNEVKA